MTGPGEAEAADAHAVLAALPHLAGEELSISLLSGGITNRNLLVEVAASGDRFVVRVPGADTHLLGIDREAEVTAARTAAASGIGAEVVAFLPEEGILVTRFIEGRGLVAADFDETVTVRRLVRSLRRMHEGPPFHGRFVATEAAATYLAHARGRGVSPSPLELEARALVERIAATGVLTDVDLAPCHNDLLAGNLIDDGEVVRIVDWEYAAMGDPRFDLANLAANNDLSEGQLAVVLEAYDGAPASHRRLAEVALLRAISDYREAAWGVLQQGISRLDTDFAAYAERHFERMLATASSPAFREALDLARRA